MIKSKGYLDLLRSLEFIENKNLKIKFIGKQPAFLKLVEDTFKNHSKN